MCYPEDEPFRVNISIIAPDEENKKFSGYIKVVNLDNTSDYCDIPVILSTPKIYRFFNNFQNLFQIIKYILGYY